MRIDARWCTVHVKLVVMQLYIKYSEPKPKLLYSIFCMYNAPSALLPSVLLAPYNLRNMTPFNISITLSHGFFVLGAPAPLPITSVMFASGLSFCVYASTFHPLLHNMVPTEGYERQSTPTCPLVPLPLYTTVFVFQAVLALVVGDLIWWDA